MDRPSREVLHMITALYWAQRSTCLRLQVGAIITTKEMDEVTSFGYNGTGKGLSHNQCTSAVGNCGCVHAEMNAIGRSSRKFKGDGVLIVTDSPCKICAQLALNSGIGRVIYLRQYRDATALTPLLAAGLKCDPIDPMEVLKTQIELHQITTHTLSGMWSHST